MVTILSPLDHVTVTPSDFKKSLAFYDTVLATLGLSRIASGEDYCGFGEDRAFFWLGAPDKDHLKSSAVHLAFSASTQEQVKAFHKAGLNAGGANNGSPGYREEYDPGYYASFILDPDGNNIEVVYRESH